MKLLPSRVAWIGLALALVGLSLQGPPPTPTPPGQVESHQLLPGTIVMWSGSLAQVPAGWRLCDGTKGTPDLRERFVLGVLPGGAPGERAGRNLGRLSVDQMPEHVHSVTTSADGAHNHFFLDHRASLVDLWSLGTGTALAAIAAVEFAHGSTEMAGYHSHAGQAFDTGLGKPYDNRPACYRLAFLIKDTTSAGQGIPVGAILAWTGLPADLPKGFVPCDGTAGTPDLNDRFVQSVHPREQPGKTGGAQSLTFGVNELPTHGHDFFTTTAVEHAHPMSEGFHTLVPVSGLGGPLRLPMIQSQVQSFVQTGLAPEHNHTAFVATAGSSQFVDKRPAFATVLFAMYTGAPEPVAAPSGVIAMWSGAPERIPTGWSPCDGQDGRPDLRDRFLLGSNQPGQVGGDHKLVLTEANLPVHGHDAQMLPNGEHDHFLFDTHGSVGELPGGAATLHSSLARPVFVPEPSMTATTGEHGHVSFTWTAGHGAPIDNRPSFYRVLFLIKD